MHSVTVVSPTPDPAVVRFKDPASSVPPLFLAEALKTRRSRALDEVGQLGDL